jgi:two-component system alkaline phosphatase synthesis response regulator PhoP
MAKKAKILVVDDDHDFVEVTKTILEGAAYEVAVAYDGKEGLGKAKKEKPDLILLDIVMPEKDGFVTADEIRKDPSLAKIPVLAITSFSGGDLGQPFPFEVEEYIMKTISPKDLLSKVGAHLKNKGS